MIPRIASRGQSFKSAGQYYLHDKKAQTSERVDWTHTHNLPTNNAHKGFGWMAHTAMNADNLKYQAGIASTGRKRKAGVVYSFSLSWHPKQEPDKETMLNAALETLERLKLKEHEAIVVAHNDEKHPHVHIICNLVHPENGKMAVPSHDRLTLSKWAENLERNGGEILCEQRVINNQKRRDQAKNDRKLALIKHREEKLKRAEQIQDLYNRSDSGKAFQAALGQLGYTLAKGHQRAFVLVDEDGAISSLSRQLKGQRAKDIRDRLKDIEQLPYAKSLSGERKASVNQIFDRDKYETERQKKLIDAAIDNAKNSLKHDKMRSQKNYTKTPEELNEEWLAKLDQTIAWERKQDRLFNILEAKQESFYQRKALVSQINNLQAEVKYLQTRKILKVGLREKEHHLAMLKLNLQNVDQRIQEQKSALEKRLLEENPDHMQSGDKENQMPSRHQKPNRYNYFNLDWDR